eukprot:15328157-Ditylum_brightwellii.AAC.1
MVFGSTSINGPTEVQLSVNLDTETMSGLLRVLLIVMDGCPIDRLSFTNNKRNDNVCTRLMKHGCVQNIVQSLYKSRLPGCVPRRRFGCIALTREYEYTAGPRPLS